MGPLEYLLSPARFDELAEELWADGLMSEEEYILRRIRREMDARALTAEEMALVGQVVQVIERKLAEAEVALRSTLDFAMNSPAPAYLGPPNEEEGG